MFAIITNSMSSEYPVKHPVFTANRLQRSFYKGDVLFTPNLPKIYETDRRLCTVTTHRDVESMEEGNKAVTRNNLLVSRSKTDSRVVLKALL